VTTELGYKDGEIANMEVITNVDDLVDQYIKDMWAHKSGNPYSSSDYNGLTYSCGCGEEHILRDTDYNLIAVPVKFIFECRNGFMTAVRVKGMLFQKSIEMWSCKSDLFFQAQEKMKEILDMINKQE